MKIWLKYLIGCVIGIVAAFVVPVGTAAFQNVMQYVSEITLRLGRYMLLPFLFFTMTVAIFELYDTKQLFKTAAKTIVITIVSSLLLTLLGIAVVLIANPPRIPISVEGVSQRVSLDISGNILRLFPYSSFQGLLEGAFLLPVFVLAGFIGAGCSADKAGAKPALSLFDSLSRVCYTVVTFLVDIIPIGMIAISVFWTFSFMSVLNTGSFLFFILLLTGMFVFIVCGLYPFVLRFVFKEKHPFRVLYAGIAPFCAAFFTGDTNFALTINLRHSEASLGVQRRLNSVCMPVFSVFARGGTALVTAIAFIVILKSYSSLGVSLQDIVWIFFISFGISFFLGSIPSGGAFFAVTILCTLYGRGFESGYLILKPAAFFMGSIATAIDTATALFGTYIIATKSHMTTRRDVSLFI